MGRRGPPPKPTAIKKMEGNRGKRPLNEKEPQFNELPRKTPPKWLDPIAKREWRRVFDELIRNGLLTKCDSAALEAYCDAYSTMVRAGTVINEKGFVFKTSTGYIAQLPHVNIKNQAASLVRQFCQEFGMTPSSRSRLNIGGKDDEEEDPMEAILAGRTPDLRVIDGGKTP